MVFFYTLHILNKITIFLFNTRTFWSYNSFIKTTNQYPINLENTFSYSNPDDRELDPLLPPPL